MKIWTFFLMIVLLASCGKERTFHVKAQNPVTGEPYDGLRVVVTSSRTAWNGEKYKTEHDGHLDSNGEAMINVKVKNNRTYSVQCEEPPNTCYTKDIQLYLKDHDEQNPSFLFEYAECGYLKFRYKNIDCQGPDDHIKVHRYTNLEGYVGFTVDAEYDGCTDYTMPNFVDVPMGWWYFEWEVTKNNITEIFTDSVYLEEGEELLYEFTY